MAKLKSDMATYKNIMTEQKLKKKKQKKKKNKKKKPIKTKKAIIIPESLIRQQR